MYIYPVDNNISMQRTRKPEPGWIERQIRYVKQKILDISPSHTSKEGANSSRKWNKTSNFAGNPMWNRGIMGATALLSQPAIDYYNKKVDPETRTVSRNRTIAKIVVGTLVGMFAVRGPVYKIVEKMTKIDGVSKYSRALLPKRFINEMKDKPDSLSAYVTVLSALMSLGIMCFTNFLLDAPLTNKFTNYLNKKSGIKTSENKEKEVKDV